MQKNMNHAKKHEFHGINRHIWKNIETRVTRQDKNEMFAWKFFFSINQITPHQLLALTYGHIV